MTQTSSEPRRASPGLPPDELAKLHKALIEEQDRILADCRRDLSAIQAIQVEGVEDLAELASMDVDQDLLLAYLEQDRETLLLIEEALQRMEEGTYGVCLLTGEPIPVERLREVPWARYLEGVQEKIERGDLEGLAESLQTPLAR
jgi:DnaK suppressor protein